MASPERRNSVARPAIDREKTTPFLLRLFVRTGGFHRFPPPRPLQSQTNSLPDSKNLKLQIASPPAMKSKFTHGTLSTDKKRGLTELGKTLRYRNWGN